MLRLEIEWLMGVCWAAHSPADREPDWPVQPDRIFSALVATWGARGENAEERAALEWLENQDVPGLEAEDASPRSTVTVFVPPNDPSASDIRILPERRRRQARQFPAVGLPHGTRSHLELIWDVAPSEGIFSALEAIARDTSYVGHSSALVRCRFAREAGSLSATRRPSRTRRAPYAGRLKELERLHTRYVATADERARPRPSGRSGPAIETPKLPESIFGSEWFVLAHLGGDRPDIRAAAALAVAVRDTLLSRFGSSPIPEWLAGHDETGSPTEQPHLAIVPLANVGFEWSDGELKGLGLVLPRALETAWQDPSPGQWAERQALTASFQELGPEIEGLRLTLGRAGEWTLQRLANPDLVSFKAERYAGIARIWTTATPIALDRHPKGKAAERLEETAEGIALACERIGLPRPSNVRPHKHSAITGAPSAWPAGGSPHWLNWARPKALAGRPLTHATVTFEEPVQGPVILGAGRFRGLGLCLPVRKNP